MKEKHQLKKKLCAAVLAVSLIGQTVPAPAAFAATRTSTQGRLEVAMHAELPSVGKSFKVTVTDAKGQQTTASAKTTAKGTTILCNESLQAGNYKMAIAASGYVSYHQEVVIANGMVTKLDLYNSQAVNEGLAEGKRHGVMAVGDVNGDNVINETDATLMMDVIDAQGVDATYDLNGDGGVNIGDLSILTENYGANTQAKPVQVLSGDQVVADLTSGKVEKGNIADLTTGKQDAVVQLAPKESVPISEANPVEVALDVEAAPTNTVDGLIIAPPVGTDNLITDATIDVEAVDGKMYQAVLTQAQKAGRKATLVTATQEKDGTIVVNLGTQIAIKKVTIKVTGASTNLVDIAQVEFVNGMENRIPEPEKAVPEIQTLKKVRGGLEPAFLVSWTPQVNITGYEVMVNGGGKEEVFKTSACELQVQSLKGSGLKTYVPYTVRVRSVNGDWKSAYSDAQSLTILPDGKPQPPTAVTVKGEAEALKVSWEAMPDTQSYGVYYRLSGQGDFVVAAEGIAATTYTIKNLQANATYEVYVVGKNTLGVSAPSDLRKGTTLQAATLRMPKYKLINTSNGAGNKTAHIESVELKALQGSDPSVIVDDSIASYAMIEDWDCGAVNNKNRGPIITLDKEYEMDTIRFAPNTGRSEYYHYVYVAVWDAEGNKDVVAVQPNGSGKLKNKKDANGNLYQEIIFEGPKKVKKVQLGLANYYAGNRNINLSEVAFYRYDSLANDIEALFTDDKHIALRDGVTRDQVDALKARAEEVDPISQEKHPDSAALLLTLDDAYVLLNGQLDKEIIEVDNKLTAAADKYVDFAYTLSDLQPLGVTAKAGEALNVYVGAKGKKQGESTKLELVFTQNYGESAQWSQKVPLKVGPNEMIVPPVSNRAAEDGGAVYVRYTGASGAEEYSVRVTGGTKIPVLDVSGKTDEARSQAIASYVNKLGTYATSLAEKHAEAADDGVHTGTYDARTCVLNVTDIVMDGMMYSVPADVVWNAIKANPAATLEQAIAAMEQELTLFYQHKGLHKTTTAGEDSFPVQRLNIRYHKMKDGVFMYAGGQRIGVGYDIATTLSTMTPVVVDERGNAQGAIKLSGWGVAHEIGHVINNKNYFVGEVTNNYYSILATGDMRSDYEGAVYKAVTSGGTGDQRTALAMYWQMHMAFDDYGNFKTFDDARAMKDNLFFARMDSYSRKPNSAPKPGGVALSLDKNSKSDNLIRLACAASEQNMLAFFEAWGLTYNDATKQYAAQFKTPAKAIQYLKPEAHQYRLSGGKGMADGTKAQATLHYTADGLDSNKVTLNLSNTGDASDMLGYEIRRNGAVVAFVPAEKSTYVDTISTGNNRVYNYEVTAYDKLLNTTDTVKLDPVKVSHDGTLGRDKWTATTNMISEADQPITADGQNGYCEDATVSAISRVIDGKGATYIGKVQKGHPTITLKLGETSQVTALRYRGDATDLNIFVSKDGNSWTKVRTVKGDALKSNSPTLTVNSDGSSTIFFENADAPGNLHVCDAAYVKVEMPAVGPNRDVSVQNIDLLGPVGDNVEWLSQKSIGTLKSDYQYGATEADKIPQGSIVFTGVYKGNPAFNVVVLKDDQGVVINGSQIIMAPNPEGEKLGDISEGTWIYWIEPPQMLPNKVKAELYRVDDAVTMDGQRMVSDTLYHTVPAKEQLPEIELTHKRNQPIGAVNVVQPKVAMDAQSHGESQGVIRSVVAGISSVVRDIFVQPAIAAPTETKASAPVFAMTGGDKNATLAFNAGTAAQSTVALQAAIQVEGDATKATLYWDAALNGASLKAYRYDAKTKMLTVYVTAKNNLLNQGSFTLGTLQMDSAQGTKSVTLTLKPDRTMIVESNHAVNTLSGLAASTLELSTNEATGGNGGEVVPESYDIVVQNSVGGRVEVYPKQAKKDEKVVVTVVPQEGYVMETLRVMDAAGKDVAVQTADSQIYSFKMPASKVTVKAAFKQGGALPEANNPFVDIAPSDYFYESVLWAVDRNLVAGVADNLFAPHMACTRAQMVVFLWRTHGCPQVEGDLPFVDVPEDAYYADAVRWAVAEGVTGGTTENTFSPDMRLTRGQTVVFLHREAGSPIADTANFEDVAADAYYANAVAWAVAEKITSGTGDNRFSPNLACTRGQIVCFLHNADIAKSH